MTNNIIFDYLLKYDNLKDLSYNPGSKILTYKDKSIDVSNVYLNELFNNETKLFDEQYVISAEDFFNIMLIHSKRIETGIKPKELSAEQKEANTYLSDEHKIGRKQELEKFDIISFSHYKDLVNKEDLTEEEKKQITDFENYMNMLDKYNEYSVKRLNELLAQYKLIKKNENSLDNDHTRVLVKETAETSSGYIDAFIVILLMLVTGIIIGSIIFFSVQ